VELGYFSEVDMPPRAAPQIPNTTGLPNSPRVNKVLFEEEAPKVAFVPRDIPEHSTPQPGERYAGLLGDAWPGKSLFAKINWLQAPLLILTPIIAFVGCYLWKFNAKTLAFAVFYYFFSGLGITAGAQNFRGRPLQHLFAPFSVSFSLTLPSPICLLFVCLTRVKLPSTLPLAPSGYHRHFAHRAYDATPFFRTILMLMGSAAFEGSVLWWSRGHRAHHKYVDTDKDPYAIIKGFWYAHIGWMLVRQNKERNGSVNTQDLENCPIVKWQHKNYLPMAFFMVRAGTRALLTPFFRSCPLPPSSRGHPFTHSYPVILFSISVSLYPP